jgi:hypothetical protein
VSFASVRAGLHANFRAYTGVSNIIGGMPSSIQYGRAIVTEFEGGTRVGQTNVFHWRFTVRVIVDHQINDIAESEIDTMVPLVHQAVSPKLLDSGGRPRSTLGGAASMCWFEEVRSGQSDGYITFGSGDGAKEYRQIVFVVMVKTQEAY